MEFLESIFDENDLWEKLLGAAIFSGVAYLWFFDKEVFTIGYFILLFGMYYASSTIAKIIAEKLNLYKGGSRRIAT